MSWDYVPGKNAEGYPDPTAAAALSNVQRSQRGLQSIIRQAKAIGAWTPQAAGGRTLELLAEEYGIQREAGETDRQLRGRIMAAEGKAGRQEDK